MLCFSGHYYDWQKGQVRICCHAHADLKLNCSPKFRCNIHHHSHLGARTMNSSANSDGAIERETISHSLVWNKILYSLKSKLLKPDHRSRAAQGDYWERRTKLELNIRTFHLIPYNHRLVQIRLWGPSSNYTLRMTSNKSGAPVVLSDPEQSSWVRNLKCDLEQRARSRGVWVEQRQQRRQTPALGPEICRTKWSQFKS